MRKLNVAFIAVKEPHQCFGQIGLEIMAELLKQHGHSVVGLTDSTFDPSSFITNDEKRKLMILRSFKPDVVCFNTLTHRYQWYLKFARLIRKEFPHTKIVFGGPHASSTPETVIREDCVDIVCVGEGEGAIVEFASNPQRMDIKNLWFKTISGKVVPNSLRPLIQDLDSLPYPNRDLWVDVPFNQFQYYLIMVSRGCPYSCSYCSNSTYHKLYPHENMVRFRSVANIISELSEAKRKYGLRWVLPLDDNLLLKPDWFRDFAIQYQRHIHVTYCATTHPLTIDAERVKLLKASGCRFVKLGIQSGSEYVRRVAMNRYETNAQFLNATSLCKQAGLKFSVDHIFGVDDSSEALRESAKLYNIARPLEIVTFQLYIFPNTPIIKYKHLVQSDIIKVNNGTFQSGSIRSRRSSPFRNLLVALPLLPQSIVSTIIENPRLLGLFSHIPENIILLMKIASNIELRNTPTLLANLRFLPHRLRERSRGYRGDFD